MESDNNKEFFFKKIFLTLVIVEYNYSQRTEIINSQPLAISFIIIKRYFFDGANRWVCPYLSHKNYKFLTPCH